MTSAERQLATRVAVAWVLANVLVSAINIVIRLLAHKSIFIPWLLGAGSAALLQASAGVALAVSVWRSAERFHIGRFVALAVALYIAYEVITQVALRAAYGAALVPWDARSLLLRAAIDVQHFFILVIGAVGATSLARWHDRAVASATERAAAEATLSDARLRTLRAQVQPALIRTSLLDIEARLGTDPAAAESVLLNLSDFLRIALLRARGGTWSADDEAEYQRLSALVGGGAA